MKEKIKAILCMPLVPLVVAAFYMLIWYSHAIEICKMVYYRIAGIPHVKLYDKFHPVYRRTDCRLRDKGNHA